MKKNKAIRVLLLAAGCAALALGAVGIFVPVLPTTPFLLLASLCFLNSSQRLHDWLMNHKYLGPPLRNYLQHRAISRADRWRALIFLWLSMGISIALLDHLHIRLALACVGLAVSVHLFLLKTRPRNSTSSPDASAQSSDSDLSK